MHTHKQTRTHSDTHLTGPTPRSICIGKFQRGSGERERERGMKRKQTPPCPTELLPELIFLLKGVQEGEWLLTATFSTSTPFPLHTNTTTHTHTHTHTHTRTHTHAQHTHTHAQHTYAHGHTHAHTHTCNEHG